MATIKVACPKCGQKVSGDEQFYGAVVECPICTAEIRFPGEKRDRPGHGGGDGGPLPIPPRERPPEGPGTPPAAEVDLDAETMAAPRRSEAFDRSGGPSAGTGKPGAASSAEEALARELPATAASRDPSPEPEPAGSGAGGPRRRSAAQEIDLTRTRHREVDAGGSGGDDADEGEIPSAFCGAVSLVSAVLGVVTCVFGAIFCPVAIIFGHLSQSKARRSPLQPAPGQALGAAGLMIGYAWLFVTILLLALAVLFKEALGDFLPQRS